MSFTRPYILLPVNRHKIKKIFIDNITRCQADNTYSILHLSNGDRIVVCKSISYFEELLSSYDFMRVSRSDLVNMQYLDEINMGKTCQILLSTNAVVFVSKKWLQALRLRLSERATELSSVYELS